MTHGDLHMAVRKLVGSKGFPFVVTTQSTEHHPGRVEVQWSVCVLIDGKPNVVARSMSPSIVLEQIEAQLSRDIPSLMPPELRAVGEPVSEEDDEA